ncbi:biotin-independent malonate decarboxylase subunit gamma [Undibacterium squillarum]|uniref:biotin-independent malonate decarboxylase subunit gamma n=1 Tax=Undibacterium squillarum TaxID=1131567 RepID=UPI0035B1EDC1
MSTLPLSAESLALAKLPAVLLRWLALWDQLWQWEVPQQQCSPHWPAAQGSAPDGDGIWLGLASLDGKKIWLAVQDGKVTGGAIGEVHGARLCALLQRALTEKAGAVMIIAESGGVRLQEANAGLIAVAECIDAVLRLRAAGIPVLVLIDQGRGCFGGMGLIAAAATQVWMTPAARWGMSGAAVIAQAHGNTEFDPEDKALHARTHGAWHRSYLREAMLLPDDEPATLRQQITALLAQPVSEAADFFTLPVLQQRQRALSERWQTGKSFTDVISYWRSQDVALPSQWLCEQPRTAAAAEPGTVQISALQKRVLAQLSLNDTVQISPQGVVRGQWQSRYRWLVTGTAGGAESGTALVLAQAASCIQALQEPVDAVLLLISTCGQRLRYQEEMLSLHQAMLHLSACLFALRQAGKPVLGLVCDQAAASAVVSGGMQCDALWALPEAQIRVMSADAIARVTGTDMTADNLRPAQTAQAHWQTGAVHQLCDAPDRAMLDDWAAELLQQQRANKCLPLPDQRSFLGWQRQGRTAAYPVIQALQAATLHSLVLKPEAV